MTAPPFIEQTFAELSAEAERLREENARLRKTIELARLASITMAKIVVGRTDITRRDRTYAVRVASHVLVEF